VQSIVIGICVCTLLLVLFVATHTLLLVTVRGFALYC